jgi:hypothetical protein
MSSTSLKRSLATLAVVAGMIAVAAPADAAILYNGHAGLGANAASITDGTSNTVLFGEVRRPDVVLMADMGGQ